MFIKGKESIELIIRIICVMLRMPFYWTVQMATPTVISVELHFQDQNMMGVCCVCHFFLSIDLHLHRPPLVPFYRLGEFHPDWMYLAIVQLAIVLMQLFPLSHDESVENNQSIISAVSIFDHLIDNFGKVIQTYLIW